MAKCDRRRLCDRLNDVSQLVVKADSPELSLVARQDDWRTAEGVVHYDFEVIRLIGSVSGTGGQL